MDLAYDQLQPISVVDTPAKPVAPPTEEGATATTTGPPAGSQPASGIDRAAERLENELENAFTKMTAQSSSWGTTLTGFWSKAKQQANVAFVEAGRDLQAVRSEIEELVSSARTSEDVDKLQLDVEKSAGGAHPRGLGSGSNDSSSTELASSMETLKVKDGSEAQDGAAQKKGPKNMLAMLTKKAQKYIDELDRDLEVVENKAGSYLTQFGTDLGAYLKEAVNIAPPTTTTAASAARGATPTGEGEVLFNVPEDIRNQIYSTRLDAQLHALHTSPEPFLVSSLDDPAYAPFAAAFSVDSQTERIAADLATYPLLRTLMERLVPASVPYNDFWVKYYFMRDQIATQEEKRKALLQQAAKASGAGDDDDEAFNWDDEEDDDKTSAPAPAAAAAAAAAPRKPALATKLGGAAPAEAETATSPKSIKSNNPPSSRPSSESSYDLVSQNASTLDLPAKVAPGAGAAGEAGKEPAVAVAKTGPGKPAAAAAAAAEEEEESDDDWE